ncbi:MAG: HdeD family acid-resistance protein [Caulobacter sp.]|nr:HdeD family acid-resistance protein [Caulobacter sp.]
MTDQTFSLFNLLGRAWWLVLLRGLAAVVFGVLAFLWPHITLLTFVILYAVYAISDGIFALVAAIRGGEGPRWWLILVGLVSLAAGVVALIWPGITALLLVMVIGAASIVRGVFEIIGAIQLRKVITNEWLLILSGAVSVLFGIAVMIAPQAGALALIWLIAIWAVVFGILTVGFGLRLRSLKS